MPALSEVSRPGLSLGASIDAEDQGKPTNFRKRS